MMTASTYFANNCFKSLLSIILFGCCTSHCIAQSFIIQGHIKDESSAPVYQASIGLMNEAGDFIAFQYTDRMGNYIFSKIDSIRFLKIIHIEVNGFGYIKQKVAIKSGQEVYSFILKKSYKELTEIKVAGEQRVKSKGDTTVYNVNSFAGKEDRSIGDVISKIPGMTVFKDGTIKYKDQEIKGLYIQGDDLMGSDYGLASNIISKDMIKSIEVIERFQPIRVLQGKAETRDVGINLVLRNENAIKLSGQTSVGAGTSGIIDLNTNVMLFNKKIKTLNSAKFNNSGKSYFKPKFEDLLRDGVVDNPGIPEEYINDNHSLQASTNYLYNFKDTLQIKTNVQYVRDRNNPVFSSITKSFLLNDTITFFEHQNAMRLPQMIHATITLEQNKANRFLTNIFLLSLGGTENKSNMDFNENIFDQNLKSKSRSFSNLLTWMPAFKHRNTYAINWKYSYQHQPQSLFIDKGIDSNTLNDGNSYQSVSQTVKKNKLTNKIELVYFINDRKLISKSIYAGIENEFHKLNSALILNQWDGVSNAFKGDLGNDLQWQQHRGFIKGGFLIRKKKFMINLTLPLVFQRINFTQKAYSINQKNNTVFVNPYLLTNYNFNSQNSINVNYIITNKFGSVNDLYRGVILNSFKEISSNDKDIQEIKHHHLSVDYNFSNKINLIDFNIGIRYNQHAFNAIYSNEYEQNIIKRVSLPYSNKQSDISYVTSLNKYVFFLKSKLEARASFTQSRSNQFVNNSFFPYLNNQWNFRFTVGCNLIENISLYYSGAANWYLGKEENKENIAGKSLDRVSIFNHNYSLVYTPGLPLNLILRGRQQSNHFQNSSANYFFADFIGRYLHKKLKTEFELEVNNLFNISQFETYYINKNQFFSSNFRLRGRMILLKAKFNF